MTNQIDPITNQCKTDQIMTNQTLSNDQSILIKWPTNFIKWPINTDQMTY